MDGKSVLGLEVPMPWCLCGNLVEEVGLTPVMYAKPISPVRMMNVKTYLAPTQKHKTEGQSSKKPILQAKREMQTMIHRDCRIY